MKLILPLLLALAVPAAAEDMCEVEAKFAESIATNRDNPELVDAVRQLVVTNTPQYGLPYDLMTIFVEAFPDVDPEEMWYLAMEECHARFLAAYKSQRVSLYGE